MGNGIERAGAQTRPIDTKVHAKAETGVHIAEQTGGAGLKVGVEKNFKLGESLYLKGEAAGGLYTNGIDAALGIELHSQKRNVYPFAGIEANYYQNPKQEIETYVSTQVGNEYCKFKSNIDYREGQLHLNGKLGLHAETKNGKFTFEGGLKAGGKLALDGGYMTEVEHDVTINDKDKGKQGLTRYYSYSYKPENKANIAGFAEAEMKLGKGISLIANGEYGNNMKQGTVGIRYTF